MRTMRSGSLIIPALKTPIINTKPSRTKQSDLQDSDINVIVNRFMKTGQLPQVERPPMSGDFQLIGDYSDAMQLVLQAQRSFDNLPAKVRQKFDNDPALFLAYMEGSPSVAELKEMGIGLKEVPIETTGDADSTGNGGGSSTA